MTGSNRQNIVELQTSIIKHEDSYKIVYIENYNLSYTYYIIVSWSPEM